jgi:hypothetical protein
MPVSSPDAARVSHRLLAVRGRGTDGKQSATADASGNRRERRPTRIQLETTVGTFALVTKALRCAVWRLHAEHGATYRGALQSDDRCEFVREYETRDGSRFPSICSPGSEKTGHAIPPFDGWSWAVPSRSVK